MSNCNPIEIDFVIDENSPEAVKLLGDHVRENLAEVEIRLNVRVLNATEYAAAELGGDYHLLFARTWGPPYDPHSYMASWAAPASAEYAAIGGLDPPLTREDLLARIESVQTEADQAVIRAEWQSILEDVHGQALFLPLWGDRVPYVINRRLAGFAPPPQAWSLPVRAVRAVSGSASATISPGAGGLFRSAGPMNPHQYSPSEPWAQDWVYEGLVSYGEGGRILPALATSWTVEDTRGGGARYAFRLREGVLFHDGTAWNCAAAALNLDHVLADAVRDRHRWLGAARHLRSWTCNGDLDLVLDADAAFYPLLQELAYVRPLRFASPSAFAMGLDSDPITHNSCEPGGFGGGWEYLERNVTCAGLSTPIGTGPFKYEDRTTAEDGSDVEVVFARNDEYWGGAPGIERLTVVNFDSNEEVNAALEDGTLDMALGAGLLTSRQVRDLESRRGDYLDVRHSDVMYNSLLMLNGNKSPTDGIATRRAIIDAIDRAAFVEEEFGGLAEPADQLIPRTAPYCDIELSPWRYDPEKAKLLNCPEGEPAPAPGSPSTASGRPTSKQSNRPSSEPPFSTLSFSPSSPSPSSRATSDSTNRPSLESAIQPSRQPNVIPSSQASYGPTDMVYGSDSSVVSPHVHSWLLALCVTCRLLV